MLREASMQKTLSDAELREIVKTSAAAYEARQNELNTRERVVHKTLDMMIDVMQPIADYLVSLNVPTKLHRDKGGITFDIGQPPNTSGQLIVKVAPDFRLVISERTTTPSGDVGTHDQSAREPSDFGPPFWRAELAKVIAWVLGEYEPPSYADSDDDIGP